MRAVPVAATVKRMVFPVSNRVSSVYLRIRQGILSLKSGWTVLTVGSKGREVCIRRRIEDTGGKRLHH